MISIETLIQPVTRDEAKQSIYDVLATVGVDTTSWKPGAVVRTIIAAVAILFAACTNLIADIARAGFLDLTSGAWLTLRAQHVEGVERLEAVFGTGQMTLANAGGGLYELEPGELVVRNPGTDKTYENVTAISIGANQTLTGLQFIAQEAGAASTSSVGTIVEFVTALPGLSCTNTTSFVGSDEEDDDALKQRCRAQLGARSANGPEDAYAAIARGAKRADGKPIGVNRLQFVKDGKGNAYIYLATPSGPVPADDLTVVAGAIQTAVTPEGFQTFARSAVALPFDCTYRVWLDGPPGMTDAELEAKIAAALGKHMKNIPIGGFHVEPIAGVDTGPEHQIPLDGVRSSIRSVSPRIFHVEIINHASSPVVRFEQAPTLGTLAADQINVREQLTLAA